MQPSVDVSLLLVTFFPITGISTAVVSVAGIITNRPGLQSNKGSLVYKGIINVEPYKPNPKIKERMVPVRRLPFLIPED